MRVSSITAKKNSDPSTQPASKILNKSLPISIRTDDVAWRHYRTTSSEDGKPIVIFWWELAHFIPPKYFRIAFFSFTIYAYEEQEKGTLAMIEQLKASLPNTKFGTLQDFEQG